MQKWTAVKTSFKIHGVASDPTGQDQVITGAAARGVAPPQTTRLVSGSSGHTNLINETSQTHVQTLNGPRTEIANPGHRKS